MRRYCRSLSGSGFRDCDVAVACPLIEIGAKKTASKTIEPLTIPAKQRKIRRGVSIDVSTYLFKGFKCWKEHGEIKTKTREKQYMCRAVKNQFVLADPGTSGHREDFSTWVPLSETSYVGRAARFHAAATRALYLYRSRSYAQWRRCNREHTFPLRARVFFRAWRLPQHCVRALRGRKL